METILPLITLPLNYHLNYQKFLNSNQKCNVLVLSDLMA